MAKSTLNVKDALKIIAAKETVRSAMLDAIIDWADVVQEELNLFAAQRDADNVRWARLCVIKSILSPGAKLDSNIRAALKVYDAVFHNTAPIETFDDVKEILSGCKYGTQCYGNNVRALLASLPLLRKLSPESMTYEGLTALSDAGVLFGQGQKARSWSLALYDANLPVYTLDRHMLRGIATLAGIDVSSQNITATNSAYDVLSAFMQELHEELCGTEYGPLVTQWALWNNFRHEGKHASHAALAA